MNTRRRQQIRVTPARKKRLFLGIALVSLCILAGTATLSFGTWFDFTPSSTLPEKKGAATDAATDDELRLIDLSRERGNIYDRRFTELAYNVKTCAVYAKPLEIDNPNLIAEKLADILNCDKTKIFSSLNSTTSFVWLGREIESAKAAKIADQHFKGVYLAESIKRIYPNHRTAAHVIGFTKRGQGLDGIEFGYDNLLQSGTIRNADLPVSELTDSAEIGKEGAHLILTLDMRIQELLERNLQGLIKKNKASAGQALLMSPKTGAILALANLPSYDPNLFWDYKESELKNRIIASPLLPENKAADNREPDKKINSIFELLELLTLNHKFRIDLPNDNTSQNDEITALQLLAAFSCVLNGGHEIKPHLLATIRDQKTGREIPTNYDETSRIVIQPVNQLKILEILQNSSRPGPINSLLLEFSQAPVTSSADTPTDNSISHGTPKGQDMASAGGTYNDVLLAAIPQENPELTLLLNLEYEERPARTESPLLAAGDKLIPGLLRMAQEPSPVPPQSLWARHQKTYYATPESAETTRPGNLQNATERDTASKMPKVIGQSLRKGLQILQPYDLKIRLTGSGMITAQEPRAGSPIIRGNDCVLKLHMDQQ